MSYWFSNFNPNFFQVTAHTDRPGYDPISSTLWRQREDYCARLIQNAWKRARIDEEEFQMKLVGGKRILVPKGGEYCYHLIWRCYH